MNTINFLSAQDFFLQDTPKGAILKNKIPNFSFVMFYSNMCEHCQNITPAFRELAGKFPGTVFAMINISNNTSLIQTSKNSITPIKYVPLLIFYNDGVPLYQYSGPTDRGSCFKNMFEFLKEIHDKLTQTKKFYTNPQQAPVVQQPNIPPYLICKPYGEDPEGVCFLSMDSAYKAK